jgi:hypothetical protein
MLSFSSNYAIAVALMVTLTPWLDWPQVKPAGRNKESMIVPTAWLAKHLKDDSLVPTKHELKP